METAPLFLDLGKPKPTLRQIADLVRAGGADALTEAKLRADNARYQEIRCRSALNAVTGMPFEWTLNPYRGCTHGCHYCYARRYQTQFELGSDDEFASIILVKTNFVERLREELDKPSWHGDYVVIGAATDCYQPIEGYYKLTRGTLEALCAHSNPTGVITKGPMIVRDKDLLQDLTAKADCNVCISVPCVDEDAWTQLEPGTVKAIADHGAQFVGCNVMFLEGGTRDHFMKWLQQEYPQLVDGYQQLYAGKYAPSSYRKEVSALIAAFKKKYGLTGERFSSADRDARQQLHSDPPTPQAVDLPFQQ
jgi:DNA repair photolyase